MSSKGEGKERRMGEGNGEWVRRRLLMRPRRGNVVQARTVIKRTRPAGPRRGARGGPRRRSRHRAGRTRGTTGDGPRCPPRTARCCPKNCSSSVILITWWSKAVRRRKSFGPAMSYLSRRPVRADAGNARRFAPSVLWPFLAKGRLASKASVVD